MSRPPAPDVRVALITGANKATACEIALRLGRDHGMTLLAGAPDEQSGHRAAARLKTQGVDARFVRLDVADPASIEAAARWIDGRFGGRLDVLINHAGVILDRSPSSHAESATFKAAFETNVHGPLRVSRAMLPLLGRSAAGRIVNVCSSPGSLPPQRDPDWEFTPYRLLCHNSSRAALHMQTVLFAAELAQAGSSIKVNVAELDGASDEADPSPGTPAMEPGIHTVLHLATLSADGPSGGFFGAEHPGEGEGAGLVAIFSGEKPCTGRPRRRRRKPRWSVRARRSPSLPRERCSRTCPRPPGSPCR